MGVLDAANPSVTATAIAAIATGPVPLPIVITHPTNANVLSAGGSSRVKICGGPSRAVQINSSSPTAIGSPNVDLRKAGPGSNGLCTDATDFGADFRNWGGPAVQPGSIQVGPNGHYVQPASQIADPLALVPVPPLPTTAPAKATVANGVSGCPDASRCDLYSPGLYSGIDTGENTALFKRVCLLCDNKQPVANL